ncbi:MAG TPA: ribonuclease H [Polyangiaceae bacterium]|nr:ribonuclease H [Polyangiaceae bacterium]
MPWIEATLRGQRVFARAKEDGALATEGGRVEIRYNPKDGRAYRASAGNLAVVGGAKVLPDDACAPAEAVPAAGTKRSAAAPVHAAGAWIAYTDGACSGNPGPAGSGVVLVSPKGKMHEGFEWLGVATNNVAELTAILRAVEWLPAAAGNVVVHTDSQYAIGVLQKGWKPKVNQELVAKARALVAARGARLVYVPGHSGVPLNERADELAREAIQRRRSQTVLVPDEG